ncbi:hypothetical protein GCM10023340_39030 [Nocardioides marinquilinus]|uniref:Uncharacterized protein n=1 Tax=Nocardioides marinquilinus TaxID=1210400 RepID=A0ABP9Q6K0_9ACTN
MTTIGTALHTVRSWGRRCGEPRTADDVAHFASARISGRYDATPAELKAALLTMANGRGERPADVLRLTEVGSPAHRQALVEWARANGWWLFHARGRGEGECALLGRRGTTRLLRADALETTHMRLRTSRDAPLTVLAAAVEVTKTGQVVLIAEMHTPARVSTPGGFRGGWPSKVHRAMTAGAARALRKWRRSLPKEIRRRIVGRSYGADWNIHLALGWAVLYLRSRWPNLRVAAKRLVRTHRGGRVIDAELTDVETSQPTVVMGRLPGFDHWWTWTVYRLTWRPWQIRLGTDDPRFREVPG